MKQYLQSLIGKVFKILPLYENESPKLHIYIDSLLIEMHGAEITYPKLEQCSDYISVLNILNGFNGGHIPSHAVCKREVFKCTNLLSRISN